MNKAIVWIIYSTFLFTVVNTFVKYLSHLSTFQIVFFRSLFTFIFCSLAMIKTKQSVAIDKTLILPITLRSLFGLAGFTLLFQAIHMMPLGSAVAIMYINPLFTLVLARFLFKEYLSTQHWVLMAGSFIAVAMIKNVDTAIGLDALTIAICSAFMASCAYTCIRWLKDKVSVQVIIFYFSLISTIAMAPMAYFYWRPFSANDFFMAVAIGLFTFFAQVFLTKAYQNHQASQFVHFNYSGILFSVLVGFFLFDERPNKITLMGMALLVLFLIKIQRLSNTSKNNRI
jgi:drug/metabolite transporter (DMT)-like permease